jgi:hypothetical protein
VLIISDHDRIVRGDSVLARIQRLRFSRDLELTVTLYQKGGALQVHWPMTNQRRMPCMHSRSRLRPLTI